MRRIIVLGDLTDQNVVKAELYALWNDKHKYYS